MKTEGVMECWSNGVLGHFPITPPLDHSITPSLHRFITPPLHFPLPP